MEQYRKTIEEMIKNLKEGNSQREIDFKQGFKLIVNGQEIPVSVLTIKEPMEKDDEKTNIDKMQILFKTKDGYILIAEVTEDKEIVFHSNGLKKAGIEIELKSSNVIELDEEGEDRKGIKEPEQDHQEPEPEQDHQKPEPEQDDQKPELNQKQANWIKLDLSAEVVRNTPLRNLIPGSDKYKEIYIVPGKDEYSYTIQGGDEESGYKIIESLERTEGRGPTQEIISIGNSGEMSVESKQALVMYKIKGREDEGFSITQVQTGNEQIRIEYWRKAFGDMYISTTVPQARADRGLDRPSPEVKYFMSKKQTSRWDMEETFESHEIINNLNKQDVPDSGNPAKDGIEFEELDIKTFKEKMIELVEKELESENGNQIPGLNRRNAIEIVNKVIDEGQNYEEAKKEVLMMGKEHGGQENDGPTPGRRRF